MLPRHILTLCRALAPLCRILIELSNSISHTVHTRTVGLFCVWLSVLVQFNVTNFPRYDLNGAAVAAS